MEKPPAFKENKLAEQARHFLSENALLLAARATSPEAVAETDQYIAERSTKRNTSSL